MCYVIIAMAIACGSFIALNKSVNDNNYAYDDAFDA